MAGNTIKDAPIYELLIPALNPDHKLLDLVKDVQLQNPQMEIVIIDDGSAPEFQTIFEELKTNDKLTLIRHQKNRGKGAALKTGIRYVTEQFLHCAGIITADSDGQHSVEDILRTAKAMGEHPTALVLGARDFSSENVPFKSRTGNKVTSGIFKLVTGSDCSDTQTGLRGISARYLSKALGVPGERYEYEMNFLLQFTSWHIPFVYLPIETIYHNENKGSHFRPVQDSARIYRVIFNYWITSFLRSSSKQSPRRFLMASLLSFAIDMSLFLIMKAILMQRTTVIFWATIIARVLSGFFNFTINRKWVFPSSGKIGEQALEYLALFLGQMVLSGVLVSALSLIPAPLVVIKCVIDLSLFFVSYQIQRRFIFGKTHKMKGGRL